METPAGQPLAFGQEHFGAAQLGDCRRTKRLVRLADVFLAHPGGTLPDQCGDPALYQGLRQLGDAAPVPPELSLPRTATAPSGSCAAATRPSWCCSTSPSWTSPPGPPGPASSAPS